MSKKADLTGQKFGRLTVIREAGRNKKGIILWECKCVCGKKIYVVSSSLRSGNSKSCGCSKGGHNKLKFTQGQKIGKLRIIKETKGRDYKGSVLWLCKCECGKVIEIKAQNLSNGHVISCGCSKVVIKNNKKVCGGCGKEKDVNDFFADNTNHKNGIASHCKECVTKYTKTWRRLNRNKTREYSRNCQKKQKTFNKEEYNKRRRLSAIKERKNLTNNYVKHIIVSHAVIQRKDITPEMINKQRLLVQARRMIKEQERNEKNQDVRPINE